MKDRALRYLMEHTDASEYEDAYDDCNIAWNVIASIMDSYAAEIAMEQRGKDNLHSRRSDMPIDPFCKLVTDK